MSFLKKEKSPSIVLSKYLLDENMTLFGNSSFFQFAECNENKDTNTCALWKEENFLKNMLTTPLTINFAEKYKYKDKHNWEQKKYEFQAPHSLVCYLHAEKKYIGKIWTYDNALEFAKSAKSADIKITQTDLTAIKNKT